tara:strand:- start:351 stop:1352 length:1002 start_codon:yes stop_codon:yes gene_type:complete
MPIKIIWGNDLNANNTFIEKLIEQKVSKSWKEMNVTNLNGDNEEQIKIALDEILTPPFGDGSRVVILRNNPLFNSKNEELRRKFENVCKNVPSNSFFVLQSTKKPDSRLKSTKFIKTLIKENLASEQSFCLPEIWDYEGQQKYLENVAASLDIKVDKDAVELIIDSIGNDSLKLKNELEKAKIYLTASKNDKDSQIVLTSFDVKKIFIEHQSNIFKVIDLLLQKKICESLIQIKYLLQKGEPALKINAGLISQIRIHTIVKLTNIAGEDNLEKICDLASISNPKRIFFIKRKVKNASQEYLINLMSNLLNIDSLLKKGKNPINVFTDNLIKLS